MKSVQTLLASVPRKRLLAVAVASSLAATSAVAQQFVVDREAVVTPVLNQHVVEKSPRTKLQYAVPTYYIVQLEAPSAIMYHGGVKGLQGTSTQATGTEKFVTDSAATKRYSDYLVEQQRQVLSVMQARVPGLKATRHLTATFNGFIVEVGSDDAALKAQLQAIPGVKRVFDNEIHYVNMDASLSIINAPAVWQTLGGRAAAGAGTKVAIVDTGINEEHPMFQASGQTPYAGEFDDYCGTENPTFCNDKLIVARSYMTETFLAGANPNETLSPKDFNGHGSHVAGTSVGNVITADLGGIATTLSGVAPGAYLMAYKACYQIASGQGSCPTVMTIAALEDAVLDGADVINNSWGGGAGSAPENSAHKPVIEALNAAGVLAVFSAGNSGPGAQTIGCPSCVEDTLTVASTQTGRVFEGSVVTAGNTFVSYEGSNTAIEAPLTFELTAAVVADANNALACEPFAPGTFDGEAVFTQRGVCSFEIKANNIAAAGGAAMVLGNNQAGIIVMSMGTATIPSVSISQADGDTLLANWEAGDTVVLNPEQAKIYPENIDVISGFSSRGPNGNPTFLKPEIAAPGSDILSASPFGDGLRMLSGTSMAAPHVAGAAALMKQIHGVDSNQLKSILMTSSVGTVKRDDKVTPANPFDVGAGRLNLVNAAHSAVTIDKPSLVNNSCSITCSFDRVITNISGAATAWSVAVTFDDPALTATTNVAAVTVPANGSVTLRVTIDSRWAQQAWKFGQVKLTSNTAGVADVVMPIAIVPSRSDNVSIVSVGQVGGSTVPGDGLVLSAKAALGNTGEDVTLTIDVPEGLEFDLDSVVVDEVLATEVSRELSADGRTFTYVSTQTNAPNTSSLTDVSDTFGFTGFSIAGQPWANVLCGTGCDDNVYGFNLGATGGIVIDGRMASYLTLGANGVIAVDDQRAAFSATGGMWYNEAIPDAIPPNGLFAPLWADLQLLPANNGLIHWAAISDGTFSWFVWEWTNANVWGDDSGDLYTVSIWVKRGTGDVYFNYINVPAAPEFATVGVESTDGTFGTQMYYDGEGTMPASGTAYKALANKGTRAQSNVEYTLNIPFLGEAGNKTASVFKNSATGVAVNLTAETVDVGFDVLNLVTVSSADESYSAINPVSVTADGAVTIVVVDEPANGTTSVAGNVVTYIPNTGFAGTDSFTYHGVDEAGSTTTTATVQVTVTNRAPTARITGGPTTLQQVGATVNLSGATSSDPDGDALTYSWTRLSGPAVVLSPMNAATTSFTIPAGADGASFRIQLTVSDGALSHSTVFTVAVEEKSSGSFAFWLALLSLPLALLRRRRVM